MVGLLAAVFDWDRDEASSHDKEKLNGGMMVVTQWTKCHGNDETARVRRSRCGVMCRVAFEASRGLDCDRASESRC